MQASVATAQPPAYLHHHHHHHHLASPSSQFARPRSPATSRPHSPVPPHLQHLHQGRTAPQQQQQQQHSSSSSPRQQHHRSTPPGSQRPPRSARPDRDPHHHHHHHQQQRYDPDYDRAQPSRSAVSLANPASSSSRELFNPNSHHQGRRPASPAFAPPSLDPPPRPRREHRDRDRDPRPDRDPRDRDRDRDEARPRTRSKREPVDPADLG
ncbi:hypothetical protein JCM9279_000302, partial [Rhodotorula babjevae]